MMSGKRPRTKCVEKVPRQLGNRKKRKKKIHFLYGFIILLNCNNMYCASESQKTRMKESKVKEWFVEVSYEHVCGGGKSYNEMPTKRIFIKIESNVEKKLQALQFFLHDKTLRNGKTDSIRIFFFIAEW
jgi:hypothetical protein